MHFQSTYEFDVPPEALFDGFSDVESFGEWMPNFVGVDRLNDVRGEGAEWAETRRMFGRDAREVFRVVRWEPPHHIGLFVDGTKGTTGRGEFHFDYRLEPTPNGTRLHMEGRVEGMGVLGKVIGVFMKKAFRKAMDADMAAFSAWVKEQTVNGQTQ